MSDWAASSLADIAEIGAGNTAPQDERLFKDGVHPFIRTSDVGQIRFGSISTAADLLNEEGIEGLRLFPKGTILIPKSGASTFLNHRVEMAADGYVSSHLATVQARPNLCDSRFLLYYLSTVRAQDLIQDHRYPSLTLGTIGEIRVPLPPLDKQKRIVAVLDQAFTALDRARANAEASLADSEDLLSSFMEGQLEVSGGQEMTLQELLDEGAITGHLDGNHGSEYPRKEEFVSDGVPYISANCIVDQQIDFKRAKYLSPERAARIRKGLAQDQDVIFAHNATVGPVALLKTTFKQVVLGTSVTYYRCNPQRILPEFLMYEMRGAGFRAQYEAVMEQATRSQVPITMQRTFTHRIPSIERQREIVGRCMEMDSASRQLVESRTRDLGDIAALRQSLLQAAFSGQLT